MNIVTKKDKPTAVICALNDRLRRFGLGGTVLLTQGVHQLHQGIRNQILTAIRQFDAFTPDNDPYGEHDFGEIEIADIRVMFKIDYYDKSEDVHSSDESDADLTRRVMTVMLSEEY